MPGTSVNEVKQTGKTGPRGSDFRWMGGILEKEAGGALSLEVDGTRFAVRGEPKTVAAERLAALMQGRYPTARIGGVVDGETIRATQAEPGTMDPPPPQPAITPPPPPPPPPPIRPQHTSSWPRAPGVYVIEVSGPMHRW